MFISHYVQLMMLMSMLGWIRSILSLENTLDECDDNRVHPKVVILVMG